MANIGPRFPYEGNRKSLGNLAGLTPAMTVNGQTLTPSGLYYGQDASLTVWPARLGQPLGIASTGADPVLGVSTGKRNVPVGVQFVDTGKIFQAGNNTYLNDDGSSDKIIELVFWSGVGDAGENAVFSKYDAGTGDLLYQTPVNDFKGFGFCQTSAGLSGVVNNGWYHVMFFGNRDGNVRSYVQGVISFVEAIAHVGNPVAPLQFGCYGGAAFSSKGDKAIAYFAEWIGADICGGSTAEMDAIALARFTKYNS